MHLTIHEVKDIKIVYRQSEGCKWLVFSMISRDGEDEVTLFFKTGIDLKENLRISVANL